MGFLNWITGRSREANKPAAAPATSAPSATALRNAAAPLAPTAAPAAAQPPASSGTAVAPATLDGRVMQAGGLDFVSAIQAHQNWKSRLTHYLRDDSSERLDYRVVCRDDQCVLGKWIHEEGASKFGHLPSFGELKVSHGQFHLAAGKIVQLHDERKTEEAQQQLKNGDYPRHSIKVMGLLGALYQEVTQARG